MSFWLYVCTILFLLSGLREEKTIKYIDLFCGIGGFRVAATEVFGKHRLASECVLSCDIDAYAREAYRANFGEYPAGDITQIRVYAK